MVKKIIIAAAKLSLIVALFYIMFARALQGSAFSELRVDARGIALLALGFLFNFVATTITILRWRALVQALDAPLSLVDALRFGFLGFAFNLSPLGVVGGDATKIVLVAKKTSISADAATASVVIDRFIGLYAMFALGLCVAFASGFYANPEPLARFAMQGLTFLTLVSTGFLVLVVVPQSSRRRREKIAGALPAIGPLLQKATAATLLYRRRKTTLFLAFVVTLIVHALFSISLYCLAAGLYTAIPSLVDHFVLYCSANVGSTIPLSAGPFEYFLDELYPLFTTSANTELSKGHGAAVGVAFRLTAVCVAALGAFYYIATRKTASRSKRYPNKS